MSGLPDPRRAAGAATGGPSTNRALTVVFRSGSALLEAARALRRDGVEAQWSVAFRTDAREAEGLLRTEDFEPFRWSLRKGRLGWFAVGPRGRPILRWREPIEAIARWPGVGSHAAVEEAADRGWIFCALHLEAAGDPPQEVVEKLEASGALVAPHLRSTLVNGPWTH